MLSWKDQAHLCLFLRTSPCYIWTTPGMFGFIEGKAWHLCEGEILFFVSWLHGIKRATETVDRKHILYIIFLQMLLLGWWWFLDGKLYLILYFFFFFPFLWTRAVEQSLDLGALHGWCIFGNCLPFKTSVLGAEFQRIQKWFKYVLMACAGFFFLMCVRLNYYGP